MNKFLIFCLGILLINYVGAINLCIDHDPPSMLNSTLTLEQKNSAIYLSWTNATDEPACSGIAYYDIYMGFNGGNLTKIGNTSDTTYLNKGLKIGNYEYIIHAWDLAGHNEGNGVSNSYYLVYSSGENNGGGDSSGGGGGTSVSYWTCGEWGVCADGIQSRNCVEINRKEPDKTELKECSVNLDELGYSDILETEKKVNNLPPSFLTGAVTGVTDFVKSKKWLISFLVLIIIVLVSIKILRTKKTNPTEQ